MNKSKLRHNFFMWLSIAAILIFLFCSCKKESTSDAGCWQCQDNLGNNVGQFCGENEQDAFDHSGNINGVHTLSNFQSHCQKK